jgi:hypothetical protein
MPNRNRNGGWTTNGGAKATGVTPPRNEALIFVNVFEPGTRNVIYSTRETASTLFGAAPAARSIRVPSGWAEVRVVNPDPIAASQPNVRITWSR